MGAPPGRPARHRQRPGYGPTPDPALRSERDETQISAERPRPAEATVDQRGAGDAARVGVTAARRRHALRSARRRGRSARAFTHEQVHLITAWLRGARALAENGLE